MGYTYLLSWLHPTEIRINNPVKHLNSNSIEIVYTHSLYIGRIK